MNEPNETPEVTPEVPAALRGVPAEKLKELEAIMQQFAQDKGVKTASGSEAVPEVQAAQRQDQRKEQEPAGTFKGTDVDWSEYNLDYNLAHLYPKAQFVNTPEGPKWAVTLDEFFTSELSLGQHGMRTKKGQALNAGEVLSEMVNSAEGWRIAAILPASLGRVGIVLQKKTTIVLPDPQRLQQGVEVAPPLDPELKVTEDAALDWMEKEGLTTPMEKDRVEGTLEERAQAQFAATDAAPRHLVKAALELNVGSMPAPVPAGQQPRPARVASTGGEPVIAGADSAADAFEQAMQGPDFDSPTQPSAFEE